MRDIKLSIGRIVSALTVLVVAAAVLAEAHAASQKVAAPKLAVAKLSPFIVVGAGFHGHENVRVTVRSDDGVAAKKATANPAGALIARFATLKLTNCADYFVTARGDEGSSARLRSIPRACGIDPGRAA